jgi:hypothetical protein
LQPDIIGTRCARKTYGVRVATAWKSCYDGSACEKFIHGKQLVPYARNVFETFITAGATRWLRVCALRDTLRVAAGAKQLMRVHGVHGTR